MSTPLKRFDSFASTESLSGDEFGEDYQELHTSVPHDLYYTVEDTLERVLVAKAGELLPIQATKYKKRSGWDFALKFRSVEIFVYI